MPRYSILNLLLISSIIISCSKKQEPIKDCLPIELQDGLIAFYPFSKGSLKDISGNKNHLTSNVGAIPALDRDENMNCSYFFDHLFFENDKSYLKLESPDFLNSLNSFSVSVWYKYDIDINGFGFLRSLVSRDTINEAGYDKIGQWSLSLFDLARGVFSENANSWTNIVTPRSEWNHLVGVKSNNEILIYLNGEFHEKSIYDPTINDPGLHIAKDMGDLFIGYGFNGYIDDVMIFNKALTQEEIEQIAKLSPCCE